MEDLEAEIAEYEKLRAEAASTASAPVSSYSSLADQGLWGDERKCRWLLDRIRLRRPERPEEPEGGDRGIREAALRGHPGCFYASSLWPALLIRPPRSSTAPRRCLVLAV